MNIRDLNELLAALDGVNSTFYSYEKLKQEQERTARQIALLSSLSFELHFSLRPPSIEQGKGKPWSQILLNVVCQLTPAAILLLRERVFFKDLAPSPESFYNNFYLYSEVNTRIYFLLFLGECTPSCASQEPRTFLYSVLQGLLPNFSPFTRATNQDGAHGEVMDVYQFFFHLDGLQLFLDSGKNIRDVSFIREKFVELFRGLQNHALLLTEMLSVLHRNYDASGAYHPEWHALKDAWLSLYSPVQQQEYQSQLQSRLYSQAVMLPQSLFTATNNTMFGASRDQIGETSEENIKKSH